MLQALRSERPALLLVDEIDKADPEFEAFLLEVLADNAVTIPELGTLPARHVPLRHTGKMAGKAPYRHSILPSR